MSINKVHLPISKCIHCLRENKREFVTIYLIYLTSSPSREYMFFNQIIVSHGKFESNSFALPSKVYVCTFDIWFVHKPNTTYSDLFYLLPLASEPHHHIWRHELVLVQQLLCFIYGLELLQCLYALIAVRVVLIYLQTSMTWQVEPRTHEVARHSVFECQVVYSVSDKRTNHSLCRYQWDAKRLWCTSVLSSLVFCIGRSSYLPSLRRPYFCYRRLQLDDLE